MSLSEHQPQILAISDTSTESVSPTAITDHQKSKQSREALKDIVFGSIAGTCGKVIEYPFDTVKVRLQSQPAVSETGIYYKGPLDCFRKSLASGGVGSLYRGVSAPIFGAAVETSSLFFSYRIAQGVIAATAYPEAGKSGKLELPFGALLLAGAASGAFTSLLLTPIELVKCQMQIEPGQGARASPKNPVSVIASVWKHHGISGFWRGQMGTLIRETGGSAAWFGSYEGVSGALKKRQAALGTDHDKGPVWHQLLAGACAGVLYNFLFYPADTIKSRMQTEHVELSSGQRSSSASSFWSVGKKFWHEQGVKGMYRGCGITVARSAPSSAIIFTIFEWLRKTFE